MFCYSCKQEVVFEPYGVKPSSHVKPLEIIGSNLKDYLCPVCGSNDRTRHLIMYFNSILDEDGRDLWHGISESKILHINPSFNMGNYIRTDLDYYYIRKFGDPHTHIHIDITNIEFENNFFDLILCNHTLEHVKDWKKGISELARVLNPYSGKLIAQTPYTESMYENFEKDTINTNFLREEFYGQSDHLRVFAKKELLDGFREAGLDPTIYKHSQLFPNVIHGVNPKEDLIIYTIV